MVALGLLERHAVLRKAADEILARKDELGRLLSREEGKTLAEGIGETIRAAPDIRFFCRRGAAPDRRDCAERAAGCRCRGHARGGRRRRHHHAMEFPDRHSRMEDRAGALPRQHGGVQARRTGSGLVLGDRRHTAPCRTAEGRAQPGDGQGFCRRPGRCSTAPTCRAITFTGSVGTGKRVAAASIEQNAQVPAGNGRQEPARRAG